MHLSSAIPWRGTPGKYDFLWGLVGGFERSFYPAGGGNEGGLVSVSLAPQGKQDFVKELGHVQVVLHQ